MREALSSPSARRPGPWLPMHSQTKYRTIDVRAGRAERGAARNIVHFGLSFKNN